jgi:hypothetical protein
LNVIEALEKYKSFHWVRSALNWGAVPLSCTCTTCYANALCSETLLVSGIFDPDIRILDDWIGATPALLKQCKSLRGTAGRKRASIAQELAAAKKKVRVSPLPFLRCPQTVAEAASAYANLSSSDYERTRFDWKALDGLELAVSSGQPPTLQQKLIGKFLARF